MEGDGFIRPQVGIYAPERGGFAETEPKAEIIASECAGFCRFEF